RSTVPSATSVSAQTATTSMWRWPTRSRTISMIRTPNPSSALPSRMTSASSCSGAGSAACWWACGWGGAGFGGLVGGARLRQAGIGDFRLIEKGGDVGGTWYWNRYPGAACDVESYIYLPLPEELGYIPTEKYARAPEILAHSRAIAHRFGLYERACLQTEVTDVRWDEGERRWIISTNRQDRMRARFVV